jgi:hypothetical protein
MDEGGFLQVFDPAPNTRQYILASGYKQLLRRELMDDVQRH